MKLVVIAWVFAMIGSLIKRCGFYRRTYVFLEGHMRRTVHKFPSQPVLNPSRVLVVIIDEPFFFLKQGVVHFAFGGCNQSHVFSLDQSDKRGCAGVSGHLHNKRVG
jgi:hypothetical protein